MENATKPTNKDKSDFISTFLKKLPFMIVGILIGIVAMVLYQGHLQTVYKFLYDSALVVFGAMVLTFVLVFGFREYLTRIVFGKKVEKAGDLIDDAQNTSNILIDHLADRFLTDIDYDIKDKVKTLAPRFANWFIWGRLRNWWWQWLVGIATFLVGLVGTLLLINQNELLNNQNKLIERQMSLEEASRRSSLIVLMSNIMDKVDDEINRQRKPKDTDETRYKLSASLIGQIAALSHAFKPYRYLDGDSLIPKPLSPERGQLLITLVQLPLDTLSFKLIYSSSAFYNADLKEAKLQKAYLVGANLTGADLSTAQLEWAIMRGSVLNNANLYRADLKFVDFSTSDIIIEGNQTSLSESNLQEADLFMANLTNVNLQNADLINADLQKTKISIDQLLSTKSLDSCSGLSEAHKIELKKKRPGIYY